MDNNEQNKTPSGLSEEDLKWLEEMVAGRSPAPQPAAAPEPEQAEQPSEAQELDEILSTDWDQIFLAKKSAEQPEPDVSAERPEEGVTEEIVAEDSIAEDSIADDSIANDSVAEDSVAEESVTDSGDTEEDPIIDDDLLKLLGEDTGEPEEQIPADEAEAAETAAENTAETGEQIIEEPIDQDAYPDKANTRPKKKDGYGMFGIPHILSTAVWLVLIFSIGISLGRVLWVCCADVMAFGKEDGKITITITAEDNIDTISEKLGQAQLVKYPKLFKFFATVTGKDEDICVGTYTLSPKLDYNAMINAMYQAEAKREVVEIMFPEGYNCAQIFKALEDNGVCSVVALEEYAAKGDLNDYWFLEGVARGDKYCLEGYLAPDTYAFYKDDSPRRVLEKFLTEFEGRFTDKMRTNFETMKEKYASMLRKNGFNEKYIAENQLTIHQAVTLASIVQKEMASDEEGYMIAAVFYARLSDPKIMSLGADITVHYALGDYFYDIKELTLEQLEFNSPYNTRKNQGIPPGPICNMGAQALYAVLQPNEEYYQYKYFVFDRDNKVHVFTKTEKEHDKKKEELGY